MSNLTSISLSIPNSPHPDLPRLATSPRAISASLLERIGPLQIANIWPKSEEIVIPPPEAPEAPEDTAFCSPMRSGAKWLAQKFVVEIPKPSTLALWRDSFSNFIDTSRLFLPFHPLRFSVSCGRSNIDLVIFQNKNGPKEAIPTLLLFQPNGASYMGSQWLKDLLNFSGDTSSLIHIAVFDYPGVGDSEGSSRTEHDLVQAGQAVIQAIQAKLGTPKKKIFFYGHSLGGAAALLTAAADPELTGDVWVDRSFTNLTEVATQHSSRCLRPLIATALEGRNFDAGSVIERVSKKSRVILTHLPDDRVIPDAANIRHAAGGIASLTLKRKEILDPIPPFYFHADSIGNFLIGGKLLRGFLFTEIFKTEKLARNSLGPFLSLPFDEEKKEEVYLF